MSLPTTQKAVLLHPTPFTVTLETVPTPQIQDPDDAIVKVKFAGLCGSDLHAYRGHETVTQSFTAGHEFVGEVVALGSSFSPNTTGRPPLYSTLKIGDKVVSPFSVSCAECQFCRAGFTSRCEHQLLFGSAALAGGQAQYVRVPRAGGTLFKIPTTPDKRWDDKNLDDASLLLLADILPTGCFAAVQTLQHPKVLPYITGSRFPLSAFQLFPNNALREVVDDPQWPPLLAEDRVLTLVVVGLGPVGQCAVVSLLDLLSANDVDFKVVGTDLIESRRDKVKAIYDSLPASARGKGQFVVASETETRALVNTWTNGIGVNAVLENVGHTSALSLAYDLIRPFGLITSIGVHQQPPVPFTGRQLYNKNVAFEFGRCPVRTMFPLAVDLLLRRQDIFAFTGVQGASAGASLVEKVAGFDEAVEAWDAFDKGEIGKVVFDPWKVEGLD